MAHLCRWLSSLSLVVALLPIPPVFPATTVPPKDYKIQDVAMTLRRTICYGRCPEYSVTVRGDGNGIYRGATKIDRAANTDQWIRERPIPAK